jgi:predicted small integral membrane protein
MTQWPTARLDPVRQMLVLAGVLPAVGVVERVLDAPYGQVWSFIEDLEHSVPAFDPAVGSLRILARRGERLTVSAGTSGTPFSMRFEVELRDGWCLMRSRLYLVGMAATPLGERTRFVHLEGLPYRGVGPLRALRPVLRRVVAADVDGIARDLARPAGGSA